MVDSGSSSNVMPLSVCKKLNATWEIFPIQIVQLDRSMVKVVGRIRNVLLRLSVDPIIHHTIDIMIAYIPETYGMWLSRYWSKKLKGYFSTNWSHLWLPLNGQPNKLKVNREPFMKQMVTDQYGSNAYVSYFSNQIQHFTFDTFFGDMTTDISPAHNVQK